MCWQMLMLGLLAESLICTHAASVAGVLRLPSAPTRLAIDTGASRPVDLHLDYRAVIASSDARRVAEWAVTSADNRAMPFIIIDKVNANAFVFDEHGTLLGTTAILLGLARGDVSPAGIGNRKLADITREERITPAGRFVATIGHDLGVRDILWVDYDSAISLHRVFTGTRSERRLERLATVTPLDNRISYGCINVPAKFYDAIVGPTFKATSGIVYILPEVKSIYEIFGPFGFGHQNADALQMTPKASQGK